jgi:ArsR family transcriptional regulator, virulence genes transcriptional regulator
MRGRRNGETAGPHRAGKAEDIGPHAQSAASLLKALANEQRLMMLCHLLEGPLAVSELNARVGLSQSALSQHLAVLREAGIVATEREAQTIYYSLPKGVVTKIIGVLHREYCERQAGSEVASITRPSRRQSAAAPARTPDAAGRRRSGACD